MAGPTRPPRQPPEAAGSPLSVLEQHVEREAARLDERRLELAGVTEALSAIGLRAGGAVPSRPIEPIRADLVPSVVSRLLHETTGMTRNFVMVVDDGPALDEGTMRDNQARIRDGLVQRALYPVSALGTPHGRRWIQAWGAIGEEQRVVPETVTEFAVFGSEAVVSVARWGEMADGFVLTRDPLVVAAFSAYFDLAWGRALPVPTAPEDHDIDDGLVHLLGMGLKDEAIARYLGIGLRTVRRRVSRLMAVHGVQTRFQLGSAVERARGGRRADR